MSKLVHALLQAGALVVQYANIASNVIPAKYQPLVAAVVAAIQAALALANHTPTVAKA